MEIFGILGVFLSTGLIILFIGMVVIHEYPKNPLRWAQERRRRVSRATVQRISTLEHSLGYRPCSDAKCYSCTKYMQGVDTTPITLYTRLWDEKVISPPPPTAEPGRIRK